MVFAGFPASDLFFASGLAHVFDEPEFDDMVLRTHFAELVDELDTIMEEVCAASDFSEPRVFIGNENPVEEARGYSMVVASLDTPYNQESIVSILGPKRMDYSRNISLLRELQELL
jgi:heat-inducible transcriptional repressor